MTLPGPREVVAAEERVAKRIRDLQARTDWLLASVLRNTERMVSICALMILTARSSVGQGDSVVL